ncbi:mechanosensitive ion channel [Pelagicoccus sp. NFK12]|uniref:Mechanosensitive ion channel n=1 Tax=Pelagicoccus enzymogenes TaxID=2773457 RepID=A0A927F624_9BACT|nr:mechanosensitive ion channel domain-containing protein [Pelagicoccus enzymogenes]MBD5779093.1 mechanosensitive ion channel [Pelagicoccus enzymogenes]MDQ8200185.1 mechanosensitive ion channel [Pelagicoccus enzymogenes]
MSYWTEFEWGRFLGDALASILIIVGALAFWLVVSRSFRALESKSRVSQTLLLPLKLIARYAVVLIALLLCLTAYGIPIGSFWTLVSTTIGLVAIGFVAVWSVLSNISATFLILLVQPFKMGDYVAIVGEEVMGRVVDINFLFTTVRKGSGDTYKVPNNQFFQKCLLRPADAAKLEGEEKSEEKATEPEHAQANLEGIDERKSATSPA